MTQFVALVYGLCMFVLLIAFLVDWIQRRRSIWEYARYGLAAGCALLLMEAAVFISVPRPWTPEGLITAVFADVLSFLRLVGYTMLGMCYAAALGLPSLPIVARRTPGPSSGLGPGPGPEEASAPGMADGAGTPGSGFEAERAFRAPGDLRRGLSSASDSTRAICWARWWAFVLLVGGGGVAYSAVLFAAAKPNLSDVLRDFLRLRDEPAKIAFTFPALVAMLEFALAEELIFRLGIQGFLAHYLKLGGRRYWIAVVLTSALWTAGHVGVLEPAWVKPAQIFPLGIALGFLMQRFGAESCIVAHGFFNVVLLGLSPYLLPG